MSSIKTPIIFSEDDIYVNYQALEDRGKLLVIGLPGSGKSTIAEKLRKMNTNIEHVNMDKIKNNKYYTDKELKKNDPSIYKWLTTEFDQPREIFSDLSKDIQRKEFERCFQWLLGQPIPMVIEGAINSIIKYDIWIQKFYPIAIKRTSVIKSIYRFTTREWNAGYNLNKITILKYLLKHICRYTSFKRDLDETIAHIVMHKNDTVHVSEGDAFYTEE